MTSRLREMAVVATPKVLGGALTVALNVVLLRFLQPAAYGAYALCAMAIMTSDGVVGSAVDNAMIRSVQVQPGVESPAARGLEKSALLLKMALWLVAVLILVPVAAPLSRRVFGESGSWLLVVITLFGAGTILLFRSVLAHWQVRSRFREYGRLDLLNVALKFGTIAVLLATYRPPSVEMLVLLAGIAPLAVVALSAITPGYPILRSPVTAAQFREVGHVAKWFLATYGVSALINRMDLVCLSGFSSIEEVGVYSGGQVFALIPEILGGYVAVVLSPRILGYWRDGLLRGFFRSILRYGGALSLAVLAAAWLAGPALTALFPPGFRSSAQVLLVLLPSSLAAMLAFPLTIPFLMFARPRQILAIDLGTLPAVLGLYAYLAARHGAVGAAWATTIARCGKIGLMHWAAWRTLDREPIARAPEAEPL
jgi:O-antigen/teichoic acid export membrane protein